MRTLTLQRFDEIASTIRPRDAMGALGDLVQSPVEFGTAAAVRSAIGFCNWIAGYHFNELAGNLIPAFGAVNLTPVSSPLYGLQGLRQTDRAIGFDSGADAFSAGDNYDAGAGDLAFAIVLQLGAAMTADILGKGYPAGGPLMVTETPGNLSRLIVHDGVNLQDSRPLTDVPLNTPVAMIGGLERGVAGLRFGWMKVDGSLQSLGPQNSTAAVGALNNASAYLLGSCFYGAHTSMKIFQHYIAVGTNAAAGLCANLGAALTNFTSALNSTPALVDAAAGRGRSFVALSRHGYEAADVVSGSTLATRDCSVQALVRWDLQEQAAAIDWTITGDGTTNVPWESGASSVQTLAGDFLVEGQDTPAAHWRVFGVDAAPGVSYETFDYFWYLQGDGTAKARDPNSGPFVDAFNAGAFVAGDVFAIRRIGTTVAFLKNGVVVYTSPTASAAALKVAVSFFDTPGVLTIRAFSAGVRAAITWTQIARIISIAPSNFGTIYARGKMTAAAEYIGAGLELRVANASEGVGELRWLWQDTAGVLKRQVGGYFSPPTDGSYILLTATRHWASSGKVILRYYLGDRMLAEVESADGSIGGGTTGTTTIGARFDGTKYLDFFDGVIDELRVVDYELAPEEVAATWDRITRQQPRAYRAIRDLLPPDAPISNEPSSRIQKLLNLAGNALGYAAAQTENFRNNLLPDRAYGTVLERHERITEEPPKPLDSTDQRRARVLAHMRQRSGASMAGVAATAKDLLQLSSSQVQFLAFDNTIREDWALGLRTERWNPNPTAQFTIAAGALRVQAANGATIKFDGTQQDWYTCFTEALGSITSPNPAISVFSPIWFDGAGTRALATFAPTTLPANGEVGLAFFNWQQGNALLFGLRNDAGAYQLVTERFVGWVSQGVTVRAVSALQTHWLHLFPQSGSFALPLADTYFTAAWSITSALAGYTSYVDIQHKKEFHYVGPYARSFGALGAALDVSIDDVWIRYAAGRRPMRFYVYRDPALAGAPDINAAHYAVQRLKQAHTEATVITSKSLLADSSSSGADRGPAGAI